MHRLGHGELQKKMNIILFGHPGSGKGTEAKLIEKKFRIKHISTGDIFRDIVKEDTELGRMVKGLIEKGNLVPDNITIEILRERISRDDCENGFILDGFPRNLNQAKELDKFVKMDKIIHINVSDETAMKRLSERWQCRDCNTIYGLTIKPKNDNLCDECGKELYQRDDDKPEFTRKRMNIYHEQTQPVIDFYKNKGNYYLIDGEKGVDEIFKDICNILE